MTQCEWIPAFAVNDRIGPGNECMKAIRRALKPEQSSGRLI